MNQDLYLAQTLKIKSISDPNIIEICPLSISKPGADIALDLALPRISHRLLSRHAGG